LQRLQLAIGRVDVDMPRAAQPFRTHLANVQGGLELFSTRDARAQPFTLALDDESGGRVRVRGQLSLAAAQGRGELTIEKLSLLPAWRYLAPQLHFDLARGTLSLAGDFDVDWKHALRYRGHLRDGQLDGVQVRAREDAGSAIDVGQLA